MEGEITAEMATRFERQVDRLPTGYTVANCVVTSFYKLGYTSEDGQGPALH